MIRNILWDEDGTLFDTYPAITYALSRALNELEKTVALNVIDSLVRQSLDHSVDMLARRFKLDPKLLYDATCFHYRTIPIKNQPPFPGVSGVCALVHERGGKNVIVAHRTVESIQQLLSAHGLDTLVDGIISAKQGYPHKPHPAIVLAALRLYSLDPDETLLIGDNEADIQAGRSAGVLVCFFGKLTCTIPPDFQIDDMNQLLSLIRK
ncbi:MAG: HAD-IA family hydrolase [Anaerolineales bacterium]|nr:HAD-IA family hydrolase [Anaerolineales bacterium]